jgi:1,6-anhydro-N-acetylmuramate kinase
MRLVAGMGRWCNRSGVGFNSRGERLAAGVVRAIGLMSGTSLDGVDVARMLAERLRPATVETADAIGWSSQAIEAQAFAYLAVRTLNGLPITFSATTGVSKPLEGGIVAHPRS